MFTEPVDTDVYPVGNSEEANAMTQPIPVGTDDEAPWSTWAICWFIMGILLTLASAVAVVFSFKGSFTLIVMSVTTFIGYLLATWMTRRDSRARKVWVVLLVIPTMVSVLMALSVLTKDTGKDLGNTPFNPGDPKAPQTATRPIVNDPPVVIPSDLPTTVPPTTTTPPTTITHRTTTTTTTTTTAPPVQPPVEVTTPVTSQQVIPPADNQNPFQDPGAGTGGGVTADPPQGFVTDSVAPPG